ncbi:MAG: imidazole glycerol phosphate synthase subunit HisH [Myxococcota bacterium]|nr:imidazole glycerol phosphate synthase subunit HisH [Myxococcota bacterium]
MTSSAKVALVDYGSGNLRSVAKALERSGLTVVRASSPAEVDAADGVVLPGAGAFRDALDHLRAHGLDEAVLSAVSDGRPYLGLCLGLQVLFEEGDEHGPLPGLGYFKGRVERLPESGPGKERLLVPHIGWNRVRFRGDHPMVAELPESDDFYFVHSYRPVPSDPDLVAGLCEYGEEFVAAVARDSVFAVQFHPEKSQQAGKRLIDAYARWVEKNR